MQLAALLGIGLSTGVMSGIFGIGGGVILVPMLIFLMKFPQHAANGTSLVALLLPVGLLGALEYYWAGRITNDHVKSGFLIAIGIFFGTYIGSKFSIDMPAATLRRMLSIFLVMVAVKLWWMAPD